LADEHSQLITEAVNTSMETPWRQQPSTTTAFPLSSYPRLGELGQNAVKAERRQQHQQPLSFLGGCGGDFGTMDSVKQESQTPLRHFFDEWPKARDSWSDEKSNLTSFSSTQLSISAPITMVSTDTFSSELTITNESPDGMLFAGETY
jgi:hypothetical protein